MMPVSGALQLVVSSDVVDDQKYENIYLGGWDYKVINYPTQNTYQCDSLV